MSKEIKIVQSNVHPLSELFSDKYDVDFYQREYSWEQKQVEDMISDLSTEFLKNWRPGHAYADARSYDPYFMGEIVLSVKAGRYNAIIDGQQRITTLTLLLIFLLRTYGSLSDFPADDVRKLIYSNSYGEKRFNLDIEERRPCMLALYNGEEYTVKSSDPASVQNIINRYADICNAWDERIGESNVIHFTYWLMGNVVFSKVWTNDDEFAYVIFETMNDRGLSLTQVEMLRSYLLAKIDPAKRTHSKETFDEVVKRLTGIKLSSKTKAELEFFRIYLRGHYAESFSQSTGANSDFQRIGKEFHRWVRDNCGMLKLNGSSDYVDFIDRIAFYAEVYERINHLIEQRDTGNFLYLIVNHDYSITLQTALLISSIAYGDSIETQDKKIKAVSKHLTKAVSWRVWNHWLISQSSLEAPIYELCKKIRGKSLEEIEAILKCDTGWYPELNGTPTLNQQNRRLTVLLSLITEIAAVGEGQPDYMLNKAEPTEIEHIWCDHYEQHMDECPNENDFSTVRNNIGDLLVLPKSFNASYGDCPFRSKVVHYIEQNVLAQSLNPQKYSHNPKFKAFMEESGLPFVPYGEFRRQSIVERAELYRNILLWNWGLEVKPFTLQGNESEYTESGITASGSIVTIAMYRSLKQYMLELHDGISVVFRKLIAGFDYRDKRFLSIELHKNSLDVWINMRFGAFHDPFGIVRDVTNVGHHGVGDCAIKIENNADLENASLLIDEAFRVFMES